MRRLKTWDDNTVLSEKFLRDEFLQRKQKIERGDMEHRVEGGRRNVKLRDAIQKDLRLKIVVQAWLRLAFMGFPSDKQKECLVLNSRNVNFFIDFYWQLYWKPRSPPPLAFVNEERKFHGLGPFTTVSTSASVSCTPSIDKRGQYSRLRFKKNNTTEEIIDKHVKTEVNHSPELLPTCNATSLRAKKVTSVDDNMLLDATSPDTKETTTTADYSQTHKLRSNRSKPKPETSGALPSEVVIPSVEGEGTSATGVPMKRKNPPTSAQPSVKSRRLTRSSKILTSGNAEQTRGPISSRPRRTTVEGRTTSVPLKVGKITKKLTSAALNKKPTRKIKVKSEPSIESEAPKLLSTRSDDRVQLLPSIKPGKVDNRSMEDIGTGQTTAASFSSRDLSLPPPNPETNKDSTAVTVKEEPPVESLKSETLLVREVTSFEEAAPKRSSTIWQLKFKKIDVQVIEGSSPVQTLPLSSSTTLILEDHSPLLKEEICEPSLKAALVSEAPLDNTERALPRTMFTHVNAHVESGAAVWPKPKLPGLPPIWAQSRQEVCETFDWFRSYQGGVYHAHDAVKGYLLSAFASSRDVFEHDGKFIISHGGGKAESIHCQNGLIESHLASDQSADDKSVRALLNNFRNHRPLVLLIDNKYALFPYDLSSRRVTYAVLGFYTIAYAWAEYQQADNEAGRVLRWKFAFRWCEEQGRPWWDYTPLVTTGVNVLSPPPTSSREMRQRSRPPKKVSEIVFIDQRPSKSETSSVSELCDVCLAYSPKVYSTWMCLKPGCMMFWRRCLQHLPDISTDSLEYDSEFLKLPPSRPLPPDVALLPSPTTTASNGVITGYAFTRGLHCPDCGRLSCKSQWEKLECEDCKWQIQMEISPRNASDLWSDRLPLSYHFFNLNPISDFKQDAPISFSHDNGRGIVQTFHLPSERGKIHHIRSVNALGMSEADDIFINYQRQASIGQLKFRRWPMRAHKCRGTLLTNYFSHNAGEPYQYVGGDANTVPFDQAPAVVEARSLIQKRIKQALGRDTEFNEVLSAAYMERQKMAFHSDSEVGLGPLVAGLSLGSPALIHFRLNVKHDPMHEKRGILLTVVLRHGDVLVMDGSGVQEYYEHTVIPNNFRIAATARQITPDHPRVKTEVLNSDLIKLEVI